MPDLRQKSEWRIYFPVRFTISCNPVWRDRAVSKQPLRVNSLLLERRVGEEIIVDSMNLSRSPKPSLEGAKLCPVILRSESRSDLRDLQFQYGEFEIPGQLTKATGRGEGLYCEAAVYSGELGSREQWLTRLRGF